MHPARRFHAGGGLALILGLVAVAGGCRDVTEPGASGAVQTPVVPLAQVATGKAETIVFTCLDPGLPPDLCSMNADGSGRTQITAEDEIGESNPDLSGNGQDIVFTSDLDFGLGLLANLYVMSAHGGPARRLTTDPVFDKEPTWSPNGKQVAFTRQNDFFGDPDLAIVNADGSGLHDVLSRAEADQDPAWSPNGKEIAFASSFGDPNGNLDIHVIRADGTKERNLTGTPDRGEERPAWSPSGRQIAYAVIGGPAEGSSRPNADIYVRDVAEGTERQLTSGPERESNPAWSRDGRRIYYVKFVDGVRDIFVMNADGSGETNLTNTPATEEFQIHVR